MQALPIDHEELRGRGDDGLEGILKGSAVFGLGLPELGDLHHFALERITPLGGQFFILDQ